MALLTVNVLIGLQWRHNECDVISNHQPHDCLLNRLFRHKSKKTSKLCITGLFEGNSPMTGEFPKQRPVMQKMFPFDDAIMICSTQDFELDPSLKKGVKDLLEEMVCNHNLLPAEHKAAASILCVLMKEEEVGKNKVSLEDLLKSPEVNVVFTFERNNDSGFNMIITFQYTVWCRYNAVNFLPNPYTREGEVWGVFWEFNVWFMFYCCHCSAVCNIMIYSTAL